MLKLEDSSNQEEVQKVNEIINSTPWDELVILGKHWLLLKTVKWINDKKFVGTWRSLRRSFIHSGTKYVGLKELLVQSTDIEVGDGVKGNKVFAYKGYTGDWSYEDETHGDKKRAGFAPKRAK